MKNYIVLEDSVKIPLEILSEKVPHETFMSETHIQVCEMFAELCKLPKELYRVHVNYLFTKSKLTKQVTSLIILSQTKKLSVKSVTSNFITTDFRNLIGNGIHINLLQPAPASLIDTKQFFIFFSKIITHRIYRLFRQDKIQKQLIIRAWVDTTDRVFPEEVHKSYLLIYPFSGNKVRQLRYIYRCIIEKRQYSVIGLHYKIFDIPRILFDWKNRTEIILKSETNAFQDHADELISMGVKNLSTTDEFEMAGHLMHEKLISKGIICNNICHGVAVYGPYVTYSHLSVYPEHQQYFYSIRGIFNSSNTLTHCNNTRPHINNTYTYEPVIVFIQGNWKQSGKRYEDFFEDKAIRLTEKICSKLKIQFMLKAHPNLRFQKINRLFSKSIISNMECLENKNPIFINIQSTSYYSFMHYGPTVFLEDDLLNPQSIFGECISAVSLESLHKSLSRYRDSDWWFKCYQEQFTIDNEQKKTCNKPQPTVI